MEHFSEGAWYRVSLRLMGDELLVDELEQRLGIVPTHVGKKGEHYRKDPSQAKYETNVWVWRYPAESHVTFEEQILLLLDVIEPKRDALKEIIFVSGAKAELFLGSCSKNGKECTPISDNLLCRIADLGLSLDFDLY